MPKDEMVWAAPFSTNRLRLLDETVASIGPVCFAHELHLRNVNKSNAQIRKTQLQTGLNTATPEVLVIGLGAMGSAITYQLAQHGVKVLGIDQFAPPHAHGSTHGETRITREAIGEGLQFVPLAMRSHQMWREIERELEDGIDCKNHEPLFTACGGLVLAREGQASHMHHQRDFLGNTFRAAQAFNIPHERLRASEIENRFPQFVLQGDETAYYEPGAGYVAPEACVRAQLELAARHGADLRYGEKVQSVTTVNGKTIVETDRTRYSAGTTIVAAGPWLPNLLPAFAASLIVRRQVLYWFECDAEHQPALSYRANECPIFIWHWGSGVDDVFYGFPQLDGSNTIKVASEQGETSTAADAVNRDVSPAEIATMYSHHISGKLRGINARCTKAVTCLYTNAPLANFIIDRYPKAADTIVVSACSGHGFKHSAAIGEAVAMMAMSGATPMVLKPFAMNCFP
jgi:sarcosine oxidase